MTLSVRLTRQLAGKCCYSGCDDRALDGSDYCAPHDAHERGRDANKKRRRRKRLAQAGLCVGGCGTKVGKRGSRKLKRCRACRKALRDEARLRRSVPGDPGSVPGEGNWRPDYDPKTGSEIQRYRGKGRRGRLTLEEQLDEIRRDVLFAIEKLRDCARSIDVLKTPDVQELPPLQRRAAYREVADLAGQAGRLTDAVEDALKGDG